MAAPSYLDTGIDANLVRLIKDGAIFIRDADTTDIPTSASWTPADPDSQIGYYSEDGFSLTPNPGDETEILGHNGDPVISEAAPGYWGVGFSGIEGNETITSAYFDVDVAPDGSVTVSSAAASRRYDTVVVGLDQNDRVILAHFPNLQIDNSSREGLAFNRTTLLAYALQFRTFKGRQAAPYHFKAWGLVAEDNPSARTTWKLTSTGTPEGGTFKLVVNGFPTAGIAYNATKQQLEDAINGISGITGITVSSSGALSTAPTLTFASEVTLAADSSGLTGGTDPAVTVSEP